MGRRVEGYNAASCILTIEAATALSRVQQAALALKYTLKVYDCYRPQQAVDDFVVWANNSMDTLTKLEFYPTLNKATELFPDYIATRSGHTRGSTVDVTLLQLPFVQQAVYLPGQPLVACFADAENRYGDNSIDMNTGFDCMNALANTANVPTNSLQAANRQLLVDLLADEGFVNYPMEWWHFTLQNEPYPDTYFDFAIQKDCNHSAS